ncbi:MAG: hypothetical protein ISR77_09050 [Pirellulaceae bacterium]|nr:hypothetical protein [Pirellulaceae bacterium]
MPRESGLDTSAVDIILQDLPESQWEESAPSALDRLLARLQSRELRDQFQTILDRLVGHSYDTYQENASIIAKINTVAKALNVVFKLRDTGEEVRVRCVNPARSKRGSIQGRSTGGGQKTLFSGSSIPALKICPLDSQRSTKPR